MCLPGCTYRIPSDQLLTLHGRRTGLYIGWNHTIVCVGLRSFGGHTLDVCLGFLAGSSIASLYTVRDLHVDAPYAAYLTDLSGLLTGYFGT